MATPGLRWRFHSEPTSSQVHFRSTAHPILARSCYLLRGSSFRCQPHQNDTNQSFGPDHDGRPRLSALRRYHFHPVRIVLLFVCYLRVRTGSSGFSYITALHRVPSFPSEFSFVFPNRGQPLHTLLPVLLCTWGST